MAKSQVEGMAEIRHKFAIVVNDLKYKGGLTALRKGANIIAKAARQKALQLDDPDTGRQIATNIAVQKDSKLQKATGDLGMRIGVRWGAVQKSNPDLGPGSKTFHWRFLELGSEKQRATPFLGPALEQNGAAAIDTFIEEYNKSLDKLIL